MYCVSYVLFNNNFFFFFFLLSHSFSFLCECIHRPAGAISFFYHSQQDSRTHTPIKSVDEKKSDDCYRVFCSFSSFSIDLNEYTNSIHYTYVTYLSLSLSLPPAIKFYLYINTLLSVNRNNSLNYSCFCY